MRITYMSVNWDWFGENDKAKFFSALKKNQEMFRPKMNTTKTTTVCRKNSM